MLYQRLKLTTYAMALTGLMFATMLVAYQGFAVVYEALVVAGWGLLVVTFFHLIPMLLDTLAWRAILNRYTPQLGSLLWMRWIHEAVDSLLPVAQMGGELVGSRLLIRHAVPGSVAGASVVVNLTLAVFTQLLFTLMGVGLLMLTTHDSSLIFTVLIGFGIGVITLVSFMLVQRRGLFRILLRIASNIAGGQRWLSLVGGAKRLDNAIRAMYRQRTGLLKCVAWQLLAWLAGAGEVWLVLYFMGYPVSWLEALLVESLGQAIRSAAFVIPGSLGIQEGGYMLLGGILGLSPEIGLALSLAKRVRELVLGLPALVFWQFVEGQRLWNNRLRIQDSVDQS